MGCPCNGCDGHAAFVEEQRSQMDEKRARFEAWLADREAGVTVPASEYEPGGTQEVLYATKADGTRYARQEDGSLKPV